MARPRGTWSDKLWRDALRRAVSKRIAAGQKLDIIAEATVAAAMKGKMDAVREIGDRLDGKPQQSIDMAVTDERNVIRSPAPAETPEDWRETYTPKPH